MPKNKILITGGRGLIGQAIAKKHIEMGDEVYLYDNHSNPYIDYTLPFFGEEININIDLSTFIGHNIDIVSHQAAFVSMIESQTKITKYIDNNITITSKLLQAVFNNYLATGHKPKLIYASSMGFYEHMEEDKPQPESYKLQAHSFYGISKQACEDMFRVMSELYAISCVSMRYHSVFSYSENSKNMPNMITGVFNVFANQIINNNQVVICEDGLQTRDLIHADDIAEAHYKACTIDTGLYSILNIGTGKSTTLKYIAEEMVKRLKPDCPITYTGIKRQGDIRYSKADISKAKSVLGWEPKIMIDEAIERYCDEIHKNAGKTISRQ